MDYNMDNHQFAEQHAGGIPIIRKMNQSTHSDRHLQDNTKRYPQDDNGTITSPKTEEILSQMSTDCTTSNTPSSGRTSTSVDGTFSSSHFVRNIIPNHHSLPFVKLEPLDLEGWGNASSDGKRTPKGHSLDKELSATHERTEFGLSDLELRERDQKNFLLKMEMDEGNFDDGGQRCEKECDECATLTNLDRENNTNCGKCGRSLSFLLKHMEIHNRPQSFGHMDSIHSVYACEICGTKFIGKRMLEYHKLAHEHENKSREFICEMCGENHSSEDSFRKHLEKHKEVSKPYVCGICGRSSNTVKGLGSHLQAVNYHTGKYTDSNLNCDVCGKSCKDPEFLERHMKTHTTTLLMCEICNRAFTKQSSLDRHYETHSIFEHTCVKCDRTFHSEFVLKRHVDSVHTTKPCDVCGKEFIKQKLKRHKAEHEKKLRCEVCGKSFSGVAVLKLHMQYHSRNALAVKKFVCEVCGKKFLSQEGLKNHSKLHAKSLKCSICDRYFSFRSSLWRHMQIHNHSESIRKCQPCDRTFKTEHLLQKHTTSFHVVHSCDSCGQQFQGKVYLNYHKRAHEHEIMSQDFCCEICGEIYKTYDSFRTHLEIHEDDGNPYRCDICGRTFIKIDYLRRHIQKGHIYACEDSLEKHTNIDKKKSQFNCSVCSRSFTYKGSLDKHFETHSTPAQERQCEKCDETFLTKSSLTNHLNLVHTMEPCNICGEIFPKGKLKYHKATHEDKQKCDVCGKYYSGVEGMRRHMQYHARSSLIKKFGCEVCGKKYSSQISLKNHFIVHKKTIKCNICGRCFSLRGNLKHHMKIHKRSESILKCTPCDKTFKTEYSLQKHTTNFHVLHSCDSCGQQFQGKVYLHCHQRAHEHEIRSRDFRCDTCGEIYKTVDSFRTHLEIHKEDDRPYRCDICGRTFIAIDQLRRHMIERNTHLSSDMPEKINTFSCDESGKRYQQRNSLKKHTNIHTKKNQLSCSICSRSFTYKSSLDTHFESHITSTKELQCVECGEIFLRKGTLNNHLSLVHTLEPCNICGEVFSKGKLKYHMETHEDKQQCDVCGKYCSGAEGFRRHMQYHARNALIKKFECEVCGKKYPSQISLTSHSMIHKKAIKCDICGRCFSLKGNLRNHMKIHKRPESILKCKPCDKIFKTEHVLQKHASKFHVMHSCDSCGQQFQGKEYLHCHELAHEHEIKSRDFCCGTCGEIYKTVDSFRTHLEIHKDEVNPYRCDICGRTYVATKILRRHIRHSHPDEDIKEEFKTFSCDICGKSFKQKEIFEKHIKFHETSQLSCNICSRSFTKQSSLDKHFKKHSTESEEHQCEKCNEIFPTNFSLKRHLDLAHSKKPCNICGEIFPKSKLRFHRASHEDKQQCDVCGKYYSGIEGIRRHMLFHARTALIKRFMCEICGKKYSSQKGLKNHSMIHKKTIKCDICGRCFSLRGNLKNHMKIHKRSESVGKCEHCDKTFQTDLLLQKHTTKFHVKHLCDNCGQNFKGKELLDFHKCAHEHEIESHDFCCDTCGEIYKTVDSFRTHLEIHKDEESPYRCDICGRKFIEIEMLRRHMRKGHTQDATYDIVEELNTFSCEVCGRSFKQKQVFEKHMKFHETKKRLFSCSICSKSFSKQSSLDKHFEKHNTVSEEHQCEKCNGTFPTNFSLQQHLNRVHIMKPCNICGEIFPKGKLKYHKASHEDKQQCDVCGKYYSGMEGIRRHMLYHIRMSKGTKNFSCEVCGKRYLLRTSLQQHMMLHKKSIKCKVCGRCFAHKANLHAHMIIHKRPPSIGKCEICDRAFKTEGVLQRHMNNFHEAKCCEICGLKFKETLEKHNNKHHTSHVCDICGVKVEGKLLLECHKLVHVYEKGSRDFQCHQCENSYITSSKLRRHMDIHIKNEEVSGRFGCEVCGKRFSTLRYLTLHVNIHRKDIGHYCKLCGKSFKDADEEHNCPSEQKTEFICEVCGRCFRNAFNLNRHKERHCMPGKVELKCEQCDRKFSTEGRFQNHIDKAHKITTCDICGQELPFNEMALHKRTIHAEKYICDICGCNCSGLSNLKIHIQTHSTKKTNNFCCNICCKTLSTATGLRLHRSIHTRASKTKNSEMCNMRGESFERRKKIVSTHKPKWLNCNICRKQFATRNALLNHKKCRRECKACGKRFVDTRLYKQHVDQHHNGDERVHEDVSLETSSSEGTNPTTSHNANRKDRSLWMSYRDRERQQECSYKCQLCRRSFQSEFNMEKHMKMRHHNNVQQFKCETCFKILASNIALIAHKRRMHDGKRTDVSGTENKVPDQNSRSDKTFRRIQLGKRGHKRESMVPFLTPRVISEDSMFLSQKETMKLPSEKREAIKDDRNFLHMVIRKSVDELDVTTIKRGQYLQVVTKMKELILNKNLDDIKIERYLKKKVSIYICYKGRRKKTE